MRENGVSADLFELLPVLVVPVAVINLVSQTIRRLVSVCVGAWVCVWAWLRVGVTPVRSDSILLRI